MKRLVLDIETTLDHQKIFIVVTKDIDTKEVRVWTQASNLPEYLKDATQIIMHNGVSFDAYHLNRLWKTKIRLSQCYDTLLVSRLLDPSRPEGHRLESWGSTLKNHQKLDYRAVWLWMNNISSKDESRYYEGKEFDDPITPLLEHYCIKDVEVTEELYHHLTKSVIDKGFSDESVELEHRVAAIIAEQTRNGFRLDVPYATCLLTDIKGKLDEIYEQMQQRWPPYEVARVSEKTGKTLKPLLVTFNPGSRQQIAEKLISLGWKPNKFTETGQAIVDEGVLSKVNIPEAKLIVDYLLYQKRISQITSWLEAVGDDGRVHGRVITNGAVTGRMTHSGPNIAQTPNAGSIYGHECRECWTVDEGNVLVGADASGLELRMLAHYMKDDAYVRTICEGSSKDGTDVHTVNQRAAGLATRDNAKTFIYAFLYGAGDAKIGSIVGGSATAGKKLKDKFLKQTPALAKLIDRVYDGVAQGWVFRKGTGTQESGWIVSKEGKLHSGYVVGLDGRKIWVRSEHAALNSLLQGAGAIVMKKALVIFYDKIKENRWPVKFCANVHDEWQWETKPEFAEVTGKAAVASIKEAGLVYNLRCPLDGEFKYGKSWKETH